MTVFGMLSDPAGHERHTVVERSLEYTRLDLTELIAINASLTTGMTSTPDPYSTI